jgi:hypothetical protein
MKNIYNAPNKEVAAAELDNLEKKWFFYIVIVFVYFLLFL